MRTATARTLAAGVLLSGLAVLTACSPPAGATDAEIDAWMSARDDPAGDGVVGTATSRIGPRDPETTAESGITQSTGPGERVHLDRVLLSCLGDGTLDFTVETTTPAGAGTEVRQHEVPEVRCADEPFALDLAADGVTAFRVDADQADRAGAWHAEFVGAPD